MASKLRGFVLVAALLGAVGCFDSIPDDTLTPKDRGNLEGRVLDKCNNAPVAGASVAVEGQPAVTTSDDGRYRFDNLEPGPQTVSVSRAGFVSSQPQVIVPEGNTLTLDIQLLRNNPGGPLAKKLDVLFVIDNSGSMGEEQAALTNAFSGFLDTISALFSDVHVGVISTDLGAGTYGLPSCERQGGDGGKLQNVSRVGGCQAPSDPWIDIQSGKAANTNGESAADVFTCIARLGTSGCGFEQPLESMQRALSAGANPGFLRDDAFLAVIVVSDEDDCSASDGKLFDPSQQALSDPLGPLTSFRCFEFGVKCDETGRDAGPRANCKPAEDGKWTRPVSEYVQFLEQLKPRGSVFFGLIGGPTTRVEVGADGNNPVLRASCSSASGVAVPAIRLEALAKAININLSAPPVYSICDDKLPLSALAQQLLVAASGQTCN
ncbi:MAG: carboxypeptidase regulatory-like domain-containing protein [Myxococcales bacterium]|nr:carboxypeptidase regulatory-like domain-containing protein [Myxococcales bacterium]